LVASPARAGEATNVNLIWVNVFREKGAEVMAKRKAGFTLIELLVVVSIIALLLAILMPALSRAKELAKRVVCGNDLKQIGIAVGGYEGKYSGLVPNVYDVASGASLPGGTSPSSSGNGDGSVTGQLPNIHDVDPTTGKETTTQETHPYACYRSDKYVTVNGKKKLVAYRFACLYEARLLDDPKMFYCPSNKVEERKYQSYTNPEPWGTLPQQYNTYHNANQWVRAGYEYFPVSRRPDFEPFTLGNPPRPAAPKTLCTKFEDLDQRLPYCTDVMRTRDTFSHKYGTVMGLNALWPDGHVLFISDQSIFRDRMWDLNPSTGEGGDAQNIKDIWSIYYQRILTLGAGTPVYAH
jgi:prepilin-type N-terminal cleavage/methylation domain-containing protein